MSPLRQTVAPAVEPVTDAELASHVRLDSFTSRPGSAPTVAIASPAAVGNVDNGAHRYRVTFVTADGETDGGPISASVTIADKTVNGQASLTAIPTGSTVVTARKVYRTKADQDDFFLLTTISNNTGTTYTDNTADSALGVGIPLTNHTNPEVVVPLYGMAARQNVESTCGRALIKQTWELTLDAFPLASDENQYGYVNGHRVRLTDGIGITIPLPPLIEIVSVEYVDANGDTQTLAEGTDYVLVEDVDGSFIEPLTDQDWPVAKEQRDAVTITFRCGYGETADDVPAPIKAAILLRVGDLYRNREGQIIGGPIEENPTVMNLLAPYTLTGGHWLMIA